MGEMEFDSSLWSWQGSYLWSLVGQVSGGDRNGKVHICGAKKKDGQCVVGDERKKGLLIKILIKAYVGMFSQNLRNGHRAELPDRSLKERDLGEEDVGSCVNCLQFVVT